MASLSLRLSTGMMKYVTVPKEHLSGNLNVPPKFKACIYLLILSQEEIKALEN